jgi:hypothetical protein
MVDMVVLGFLMIRVMQRVGAVVAVCLTIELLGISIDY